MQKRVVAREDARDNSTKAAALDVKEWTGLFLFRSTPLREAAARLSQRYGVAITISPDLEAEGVSGTFAREQSLRQILDALATTLNAAVQGNDVDGYMIGLVGQ